MKQIREFRDEMEALIAKDYLLNQGIQSDLKGGKEYATFIVGGTVGRYFLAVDENDWSLADELLRKLDIKVVTEHPKPTQIAEVALKKSVMWAVIAVVVLPVIGNYISIREAYKYARLENNTSKRWAWLVVISWMQVLGILLAYILIKSILGELLFQSPL